MTDPTTPTPPDIRPLAVMIAHDLAQKALTVIATAAIGKGLLAPGSEGQFIDLGVAFALSAASVGWTFGAAWLRRQKMVNLKFWEPKP